jgi:magnesium transporter
LSNVPIVPHIGTPPEGPGAGKEAGSKKEKRKQKYLDSLMDKAGELSLKCESVPLFAV